MLTFYMDNLKHEDELLPIKMKRSVTVSPITHSATHHSYAIECSAMSCLDIY